MNILTTGELFATNQAYLRSRLDYAKLICEPRRYYLRGILLCVDIHVVVTKHKMRRNTSTNTPTLKGLAALNSKTLCFSI